jgi:hypothetical protein
MGEIEFTDLSRKSIKQKTTTTRNVRGQESKFKIVTICDLKHPVFNKKL